MEADGRIFKQEMQVLREFSNTVRSECVLNQHFFSFYDIPDLIVKKRYQRKDYDSIIKLLNKVKKLYLAHKATIVTDKPIKDLVITDEDLVPLELFDTVLSNLEQKFEGKRKLIVNVIIKMKSDA